MKYLLIMRDIIQGDEWVHPAHFETQRDAEHIGQVFQKMDKNISWWVKEIDPQWAKNDNLGGRAG